MAKIYYEHGKHILCRCHKYPYHVVKIYPQDSFVLIIASSHAHYSPLTFMRSPNSYTTLKTSKILMTKPSSNDPNFSFYHGILVQQTLTATTIKHLTNSLLLSPTLKILTFCNLNMIINMDEWSGIYCIIAQLVNTQVTKAVCAPILFSKDISGLCKTCIDSFICWCYLCGLFER